MAILKLIASIIAMLTAGVNYDSPPVLDFENYKDSNIAVPNNIAIVFEGREYGGSLLQIGNLNEIYSAVPNKYLDHFWLEFFSEQDIINGWLQMKNTAFVIENSVTRSQKVENLQNQEDLILEIRALTKYCYSNMFNSYLFLIVSKHKNGYSVNKSLYLLNERNSFILSIARVSKISSMEGSMIGSFSFKSKNNGFQYISEVLESDNIIDGECINESEITSFYLDHATGYFKIH